MKRIIFITVLCAFTAAPALADMYISVDTNADGLFGNTSGGEFLVTVLDGPIGIYATTEQFKTFCIETNEFLSDGGHYWVTIDTEAWQGGTGGPDPDPLSPETAYLYSLWLDGIIPHNNISADALQEAIWYLEEETLGQTNWLVDDAKIAVADGGIWFTKWGEDSIGDIRVMNLWTNANHTGDAQDLLVRVPVPGAILLGILGLGVAGLKLRKYS